jgi:hypothetical protein
MYNKHIVTQLSSDKFATQSSNFHIIPNNGNKYYLFITKKNKLEQCKDSFNIMYFFPDSQRCNPNANRILKDDFFVEINNTFDHDILLEGYLYENEDKYSFLTTDILVKNSNVVDVDYSLRYTIVNELLYPKINHLTNLNNHITIGIHPTFTSNSDSILDIFKNNFVFKHLLCSIEYIYNFTKQRYTDKNIMHCPSNLELEEKVIRKAKLPDVYTVHDVNTGNQQGILYVKGLKESKYLKSITTEQTSFRCKCSFNKIFNKWQPVNSVNQ